MLPRLEATAELRQINALAIGFGGVKAGDRARHIARLEQQANGEAQTMQASPAMLAMMGIAVVVVPGPGKEPVDG